MAFGHQLEPEPELIRFDETSTHGLINELEIVLSPGGELREREVVHLHTPCDGGLALRGRCLDFQSDESAFPSGWGDGSFGTNPMRVVPEGLVKARTIAQRAVDLARSLWIAPREEIYFE